MIVAQLCLNRGSGCGEAGISPGPSEIFGKHSPAEARSPNHPRRRNPCNGDHSWSRIGTSGPATFAAGSKSTDRYTGKGAGSVCCNWSLWCSPVPQQGSIAAPKLIQCNDEPDTPLSAQRSLFMSRTTMRLNCLNHYGKLKAR